MVRVALRSAQGGWEVSLDGSVVVWDLDLERAAVAALCIHARREAQSPIELCPEVRDEDLEKARRLMATSLRRPMPSVRS